MQVTHATCFAQSAECMGESGKVILGGTGCMTLSWLRFVAGYLGLRSLDCGSPGPMGIEDN